MSVPKSPFVFMSLYVVFTSATSHKLELELPAFCGIKSNHFFIFPPLTERSPTSQNNG